MKRVLKPGGRFIIVEMYSNNQTPEQMSHVQLHHFGAEIDRVMGVYHEETYTRDHIIDIVSNIELNNLELLDYKHVNDNPKDTDLINHLTSLCDQLLSRVIENENYDKLKEKCEDIKNWIKTNGFNSATELLVIGEKLKW